MLKFALNCQNKVMKNEHLMMSLCVLTKWGNWNDVDHILNFHNLLLLILILICIMQIKDGCAEGKDLVLSLMSTMERSIFLLLHWSQ